MAPKRRILSGMRPTGRFHLGNYLGAAKNWVELQNSGDWDCFYMVADYHALTTKPDAHEFQSAIHDLAADMLAVGIDPERSVLYLQSSVPEVTELTLLFTMVTPLSWLLRTPTFKEMARQHPDNVNVGLLEYPVLQGADILLTKGQAVPVGKDQVAHLELIREIVRRFNRIYEPVFPEPEALLTETPLLLGTDGKQRMSKTVGNVIGVTEEPEVIRRQVLSMVTDTKRIRKTDPGHPRTCNVDAYYKIFFPDDWQDYWEACRTARMGCHEKKQLLAERIIDTFKPFRERRESLSREDVSKVLARGSERAHDVAVETVREARSAVGLLPPLI